MVHIYGEDLKKTLFPSCGNGIRCVVCIGPSVRPVGKAAIRQMVYDAFVWICIAAEKYQTVQNELN
jgi:hypothetical protein